MKYELPYFGLIEINPLKKDYRIATKIGDRDISLDINFKKDSTDSDTLKIIKDFLKNIEKIDVENQKHFINDFYKKGETDDHLEFYLEELFEEELIKLIEVKQSREKQKLDLLSKFELIRVGIYPDNLNYFGTFDYSIRLEGEFSNQLLVLNTKENGKLDHITWES